MSAYRWLAGGIDRPPDVIMGRLSQGTIAEITAEGVPQFRELSKGSILLGIREPHNQCRVDVGGGGRLTSVTYNFLLACFGANCLLYQLGRPTTLGESRST